MGGMAALTTDHSGLNHPRGTQRIEDGWDEKEPIFWIHRLLSPLLNCRIVYCYVVWFPGPSMLLQWVLHMSSSNFWKRPLFFSIKWHFISYDNFQWFVLFGKEKNYGSTVDTTAAELNDAERSFWQFQGSCIWWIGKKERKSRRAPWSPIRSQIKLSDPPAEKTLKYQIKCGDFTWGSRRLNIAIFATGSCRR